jgi:hypothetical protein
MGRQSCLCSPKFVGYDKLSWTPPQTSQYIFSQYRGPLLLLIPFYIYKYIGGGIYPVLGSWESGCPGKYGWWALPDTRELRIYGWLGTRDDGR